MKPIRIAAAVLLSGALILCAAGALAGEGAVHPVRLPVARVCPCYTHARCRGARIGDQRAWYFEPDAPHGGAVILLHGVGDNRQSMLSLGNVFLRAGYAVLAPDLRGHGESGGIATYGVLERDDVHAWVSWMLGQPRVTRVYGFGASLGASVLLESLDRESRFRAVVAESAYSDFPAIADERMRREFPGGLKWMAGPFVDSGLLWIRLRYSVDLKQASALDALRHTQVPVLLIHGLADGRTSPDNSRRLAAANPAATQLWLVANSGHANAWATAGKEFEIRVLGWFDR